LDVVRLLHVLLWRELLLHVLLLGVLLLGVLLWRVLLWRVLLWRVLLWRVLLRDVLASVRLLLNSILSLLLWAACSKHTDHVHQMRQDTSRRTLLRIFHCKDTAREVSDTSKMLRRNLRGEAITGFTMASAYATQDLFSAHI
jgi:hypothetical protein